jgi:gas vesicle protein
VHEGDERMFNFSFFLGIFVGLIIGSMSASSSKDKEIKTREKAARKKGMMDMYRALDNPKYDKEYQEIIKAVEKENG